ncbi:MAG: tetratricopeptide repeat protein [Dysgonamonadaceae bacterium]|jgi:hypothetical protein|nr:tetratricopeptide repeat protein [Dysgonamonadaceae bacterium]
MIKANEINRLVRGEQALDNKSLAQISSLLAEYPAFQAAHLLYALNYLELKDSRFTVELRKAALYLNDRRKMFFLVNRNFFSPQKLERLETKGNTTTIDPFERIDRFLEETETAEEPVIVSEDYVTYNLSEEAAAESETENAKLHGQELIDRFLEEDRRQTMRIVPQSEPESSENSDEQPFPDDSENSAESNFFSETLAKIYIKQKKYSRALEIISKLNLLYPEKSRYFAAQIRFLEKLIENSNNNK